MHIKKYLQFVRTGVYESGAYRMNALMSIANAILFLILSFAIWRAIAASGTLADSLSSIMTYLVLGQVVSRTAFVSVEQQLTERIREGTIVNELKRPISLRLQLYSQLFGHVLFKGVTVGIPMMAIGTVFFNVAFPTLTNFVAFMGSLFLAFTLVFSLSYMTAMFIFWTKVGWSIRAMRSTLMDLFSGVLFPLYLLPTELQTVFNLLPFQSMVDAPIRVFRMDVTGSAILNVYAEQVLWILILTLLGELLWRRAKTKLTVQGG